MTPASLSNPLRIAVAGAGAIGMAHIAVIQQSAHCVLSAIVDPSPSAAALAAAQGVPLYISLDELLAQAKPDGIILATPNALHVTQALQCMAAGVPLLLEKPIATTVQEAQDLVEHVEAMGAPVLIGHHRAHSAIMAQAKQVVDSGRLGTLVAVMGSAMFFKPDSYFSDAPWRREMGAGPILINMIHEVHNLRMLCGDIVAVQAFKSHTTRGFAVEDTVAINLRFASGALGSFMLSDTAASARSWEQTSQENKAYVSYDDEDCYVISGTFGSLSVPTMRLKTYARAEDRSWWKPFEVSTVDMVRDDPLVRQMDHFCDLIHGRVQPLVSARDGLNNLRVTEAISQAAQTGGVVALFPNAM
jgi:predicted dehydrogenase